MPNMITRKDVLVLVHRRLLLGVDGIEEMLPTPFLINTLILLLKFFYLHLLCSSNLYEVQAHSDDNLCN